jgi:ribosome-associated protein
MVFDRLAPKINTEGFLSVVSQRERSQALNKSIATDLLKTRLEKAIIPKTKRKATRPTAESRQERLDAKKRRSETKSQRKKPDF